MAKKTKTTDARREKVEEIRAQQKAAERKRTMLLVGIFALVGVLMIGAAAWALLGRAQERTKAYSEFGVAAAEAGCGDVLDDPTTGQADHVADGTRVEYTTSPPSSGSHYGVTAGFDRQFYTRDDTPPLENLVHNLEHGATIIWYDESVSDDDIGTLESLSRRVVETDPKVIVAAWNSDDRGAFPEGHIAISHWGENPQSGYRQYCERPSGEVISKFVEDHPYTDSPEPQGG